MKFKTEKQVVEEDEKSQFESNYFFSCKFIENYLGISLETIEKAAIRQNLAYILDVECSPLKFDLKGDLTKCGAFPNPSLGLECLILYVRFYGIEFGDVWYNGNQPWFKQEFRRRREECLML